LEQIDGCARELRSGIVMTDQSPAAQITRYDSFVGQRLQTSIQVAVLLPEQSTACLTPGKKT
jgi:hypothetical protein